MMIREILNEYMNGKISLEDAENALKLTYIEEIEQAVIDHSRKQRTGIPEVIHGEHKDPDTIFQIADSMLKKNGIVMITRAQNEFIKQLDNKQYEDRYIEKYLGGTVVIKHHEYIITPTGGKIGLITAGTSDTRVAEEARAIAELMGCQAITAYDVGIAGLHRILSPLKMLIKADVDAVVVCAGMEGALPSVVAGLVDVPVIGVPVSTGYGLGEKGLGALMGMLQSCSPGLTVVNIDNGFNAGATAAMIANRVALKRKEEFKATS